MTYTLTATTAIIRDADQACIPDDPRTTDYQAYLAWVAEGNAAAPYVTPPAPPITVSRFQFKVGLTKAGIRAQAEAAVAASTDQTIKDAYAEASVFIENDQFVTSMAASLGLTAEQIHDTFVMMQGLAA